jgi:hypothetical protein
MVPGVYLAFKKDKTKYYRASITFSNKHISLGSYDSEEAAGKAYSQAQKCLYGDFTIHDYNDSIVLSFDKWVTLINFRDNGMYIKTPIYLQNKYFEYYLSQDCVLKFDVDDLFYYSHHKIMQRDGYLFVADYGMQVNILSRYGIKNHAVEGRDFKFANSDASDYRYGNVQVINKYHGVLKITQNGRDYYKAKIHINGDYVIGRYDTEAEAAIAYNKSVNILKQAGINKNYPENYLEDISAIEYAKIYNKIAISAKIRNFGHGY